MNIFVRKEVKEFKILKSNHKLEKPRLTRDWDDENFILHCLMTKTKIIRPEINPNGFQLGGSDMGR